MGGCGVEFGVRRGGLRGYSEWEGATNESGMRGLSVAEGVDRRWGAREEEEGVMEMIVVCLDVISFQSQSPELLLHPLDFNCWAVFRSHHRLEFSPWNMVSIDEP
ncbi:hypothetical protein Tco_1146508 [Tanacetum coccineum]